ncbi:pro-interleukin-16-like [Coregonus clupeaformis]|uniref:pro-interleukin-16-like n=1 Tax=Coregonus clupeaformis TaxID=59861 RepID=UPI001E1C3DE8|nr:pro-interleukin-16-like [Coregonus clupeaformis]
MGNTAQEKEKRTDVEGKRHKKKEAEKQGRENAEVSLPQHSQSVTRTRDSQPITTPGVGVTTGSNSRLTNQLNGKTDTYDRSKTPARGMVREVSLSEDVFEANTPERIHLQNTENTKLPGKLVAPSAASVRNKIHQFEALTQTSQVPVPNYLKPRRAFSVPEQLSEAREAVKLPFHPQNSPFHPQNSPFQPQNSPFHPQNSPFHPQNTSPHLPTTSLQPKHQQGVDSGLAALKHPPVSTHTAQGRVTTDPDIPVSHSGLGRDSLSLPLSLPLTSSSSPSSLPLLPTLARWNSEEGGWSDEEDTDDEGTEKDEDSNYDSDSAESSVTITSTMSQSHRRSFSLSLAELCNFGEVDYDPQSSSDSEEWLSSRSASLSSDVSALSCVSVLGSDELDRLLDDVKGLGDTTLQNYEDVQVVVLHKEVGVGLGFTMAGGVDQNKPVIVHKVFPAGVAAEEGSIQEGDKVLSINGTALCGSSHSEVLRTLRRARTQGMGVVVLRRGGVTDPCKGGTVTDSRGGTQTEPTNTGQRVCVRLEKRSRDLGFSLEGGVGSSLGDKPLTVQKLFLGGPVNQVSPGDEVLEIEGVSLVGLRRLEAWTLIRTLPPGPVDVVLHRPHKPQ